MSRIVNEMAIYWLHLDAESLKIQGEVIYDGIINDPKMFVAQPWLLFSYF